MAWLHKNKEDFYDAINMAAEKYGIIPSAIEKDYYVTLILKELSESLEFIVFKGGTSLSKCHKVIKRFSEDIDIAIDTALSQGQKKKLKVAIKDIAEKIGLRIPNIEDTRSRKNYNMYILEYEPVISEPDNAFQNAVLMETSFTEISFPTVIIPVHSYIGDLMTEEELERLKEFGLEPFEMKVQGIDRTLADKVFAICDYYMQDKVKKHSRHIYDIYKLLQIVPQTEEYKELVQTVRKERAKTNICPSAQPGVDIPEMLKHIVKNEVYKDDYNSITVKLLEEQVLYETAVEALTKIAESGIFIN